MGEEIPDVFDEDFEDDLAAPLDSVPFTQCSGVDSKVTVSAVDATPFPPTPGQSATVTVSGTSSVDITDGDYTLTVSLGGFPFQTLTGKVCDLVSCPVKAGDIKLSKSLDIPSIAPPGTYGVKVDAKSGSGDDLVCVDLTVTIGGGLFDDEEVEWVDVLPPNDEEDMEDVPDVFDDDFEDDLAAPLDSVPFTQCSG